MLYLNGEKIVDNNGCHGEQETGKATQQPEQVLRLHASTPYKTMVGSHDQWTKLLKWYSVGGIYMLSVPQDHKA